MRSNSCSMAPSASLFCSCLHNAGKAINLTSFFGTLGNRLLFSDCSYIIKHICGYVNNKPYDPQTRFNSRRSTFSSIQTGGWFTRNYRQKPPSPRSHFLLTTASQRTRFPPSFPPPTPIPLPDPLAHIRSPQLVRLFIAPSPAKPESLHAPFCTNSPTPHPTTRHIPQKTRPSPTLYTLHNCSTSNIFKIIMSQVLDICTPI